jgi:histidyl-tRNA synthetase
MVARTSSKKYNQAAQVAKLFGFDVEKSLSVSSEAIKLAKQAKKEPKYFDPNMPPIEEAVEMVLRYKEFEKENGSIEMFKYFDKPATGSHSKLRKRPGEDQISLNIMGVEKSVAEALMIKTISTILAESGIKKHTLHLNNVGGKESQTQFNREATAFFRKNISLLNATCRQYFKESVHTLITEGGDQCKILKEHAPEPLDFLGEETRQKFSNLLERTEALGIPYEINPDVLGDLNYSNHTTFQFVDDSTGKVVAAGTRYNLLSKKMGMRREIPAMSANVWLQKSKEITDTSLKKIDDSKIYLLQVGPEAKTAALRTLELLWQNRIFVKHSIVKDKVSAQIAISKKLKAEYIIIIGHKEALDGNTMVRDHEVLEEGLKHIANSTSI